MWPFKTKETRDTKNVHDLNDEDRQRAFQTRDQRRRMEDARINLEIQKLNDEAEIYRLRKEREKIALQHDIADLQDQDADYDEEPNADMALMKMFAPIIANVVNKRPSYAPDTAAAPVVSPSAAVQAQISDQMLEEIWQNTPPIAKKYAAKMNDQQLKDVILRQMPTADEDTLQRAVAIVRAGAP